jgi:hypothetical protein
MDIPKLNQLEKLANGKAKPIEILTVVITSALLIVVLYDLHLNIKSNKLTIKHMEDEKNKK